MFLLCSRCLVLRGHSYSIQPKVHRGPRSLVLGSVLFAIGHCFKGHGAFFVSGGFISLV